MLRVTLAPSQDKRAWDLAMFDWFKGRTYTEGLDNSTIDTR
jgi:hypothetical protein